MNLTMIELYSGSGTVARAFAMKGFKTLTVDHDEKLTPDFVADITTTDSDNYRELGFDRPGFIWASPDCRKWSWASGARNEFRAANTEPLSDDAIEAQEMVKHTLQLIEELEPTYWVLENPDHGALKDQAFMKKYPNTRVMYCAYGHDYQKRTRLWGNFPPSWIPKTTCSHIRHKNIKTYKDAYHRSMVPFRLALDLVYASLEDKGLTLVNLADMGFEL